MPPILRWEHRAGGPSPGPPTRAERPIAREAPPEQHAERDAHGKQRVETAVTARLAQEFQLGYVHSPGAMP